ncbi:MAG: hypothetical protein ABJA67_15370 [Chthonomonadales bacterium]
MRDDAEQTKVTCGGCTVDLTWKGGRVVKYRVRGPKNGRVSVLVNGKKVVVFGSGG